ncbi:MAG: universal stress protein [Desulfobacterales bacterium]|jgi:nucleotide-binding universal stress UspA family protein|nr:universal stress protein [Desulfobacterales bacterium]
MYEKILVPLDGSAHAEAILPHVEKLAQGSKVDVVLLYVDDTADLMLERDEVADVKDFIEKRRQQVNAKEAYLQSIIDRWREKGIAARMQIVHGSVVAGIMDCAAKEAVDLIAMASHGMGGMQRTFYGSSTAGVLNCIDRPLLLIRSRFQQGC